MKLCISKKLKRIIVIKIIEITGSINKVVRMKDN